MGAAGCRGAPPAAHQPAAAAESVALVGWLALEPEPVAAAAMPAHEHGPGRVPASAAAAAGTAEAPLVQQAPPAPAVVPPPASVVPALAPGGAARVVDRGSGRRRAVALTFDAGADLGFTSAILDTLRARGVRASFGLTGAWAEQHPELVRRIASDGHVLINHSYDHSSFTGASTQRGPLPREGRWAQLDRTARVLRDLTGQDVAPYFRPPYGDWDASVNGDVAARGYTVNVMWTVDSRGWQGLAAREIERRCVGAAAPGAIYIFHVGSQSQDAAALGGIIDGLRGQGYAFETVAELLVD